MHRVLNETRDDLVALEVSGTLDSDDDIAIIPMLEDRIRHHGTMRLYWEMVDFEGSSVEGFGEDVKFHQRHADGFSGIAIVGEKKWQQWMKDRMQPFASAEIRCFDGDERLAALTWIQGK